MMTDILKYILLIGGFILLVQANSMSEDEKLIDMEEARFGTINGLQVEDNKMDRRNDFFFAKNNHKSVPRIGRRNDFFHKAAKSVPRIGRSAHLANENRIEKSAWPWFRDMDYYPRIVKKELDSVEESDDFLGQLDLNKELEEIRLQPVVHH